MGNSLYIELNIVCMVIIGFIYNVEKKGRYLSKKEVIFNHFIFSLLAMVISDTLWKIIDINKDVFPIVINKFINCVYMICTCLVCFLWLLYSESERNNNIFERKKDLIICAIPFLLVVIMIVASCWTGWIFKIDANNAYHRGSLIWVQQSTAFLYGVIGSLRALYAGIKEKNFIARKQYLILSSFVIIPIIGFIIQIFFIELGTLCISMTLALLSVFISLQQQKITLDSFTKLNNRDQMYNYLSQLIESADENNPFYLTIMDIDDFKSINDTYGHLVGDEAILLFTKFLKMACGKNNCFAARYGGDEFVMIAASEQQILNAINDIRDSLEEINNKDYFAFTLQFSYGVTYGDNANITIGSIISEADKKLYDDKLSKKIGF